MFTNNYIAFRHNYFFGHGSGTSDGITARTLMNWSGESFPLVNGKMNSDIGNYLRWTLLAGTPSTTQCGVVFGSGTTPATREDYKLESILNTGELICLSAARSFESNDDGSYNVFGIYTLQNTSSKDVSIAEVGIVGTHNYYSTSSYSFLMERTVLDDPVIIKPGEAKQITYKITFQH